MKLLDLTLASPAENLACDEVLLDHAEDGGCEEILRFWEPTDYFVVVGYSNTVATEVNVAACETRGIPVLRRCSGGGTVLQGPGCLNYTLVMRIEANGLLQSISTANRFIMERNRAALESVLERHVKVAGHTDLAVNGLKFSGNSQRRRRRYLLFHGTFLLKFDIAQVEALLPPPSKQPDYRQYRSHSEFLLNLHQPADTIKAALAQVWNANAPLSGIPSAKIETLVREKYATQAWSFKF